ncbi:TonB family protein [Silvibacterium bohemicum]|uniref:TonB family protein n=1 Tax=Silvibacterium bohemicum TaxID=1577686 RepID=A0A841JVR3_9BACT|nr:energy transducer TonB [Silvibacterium bohemicum]MBB6145483.1 TonB family protein [Silvibacterium bohemicum]
MNERELHEFDAEMEQAMYGALARVAAPASLIGRVEQHLLQAERSRSIPTFQPLKLGARSAWMSFWSVGAHVSALALIVLVVFAGGKEIVAPTRIAVTPIDVKPYLPITLSGKDAMGGGGGGGAHELIEASKGHLPKFADKQITPPQIIRNEVPKLPIEATVVMPPIQLPDANMPNVGVPQSPQVSLASQGPGSRSGLGTGDHGGIGPGNGNGVGPGTGGDYGGGVMSAGAGVSAPVVIYSVDPEFSDEARRAKYQGICPVALIVDEHGNPTHIHVERSLGMGLDEKAVEAVKQYRFRPAYYHGHPVAVEMVVVVNFRIF